MRFLTRARPSPAMIVACVALSAALAGSAIAGTSAVSSKLTKKSVKKIAKKQADKEINKKAPGLSVAHAATSDTATNVANSEAWHVVGAAGEPAFGNGGQNDCQWSSGSGMLAGINPVAFFKDKVGMVHLAGVPLVQNGPGGDGTCGPADGLEDFTAFTLPEGFRPDNLEIQISTNGSDIVQVFIGADTDTNVSGTTVPAGAVIPATIGSVPTSLAFDGGIEFRAAGTGSGFTASKSTAGAVPSVVRQAVENLEG